MKGRPWITLVAILLSAGVASAQEAGLVGAWNFDEEQGTTVLDSGENGLNGIILNANNVTRCEGRFDGALEFAGTDEPPGTSGAVVVAGMSGYDLTASFTVETWMQFNDQYTSSDTCYIASDGNWRGPGWRLLVSYGELFIQSGDGQDMWGASSIGSSRAAFEANRWYHVAATFDGSAYRLYLDGTQVGLSDPDLTLTTGTDTLSIGSYNGGYSTVFKGALDHVRIYNRAKSAVEIAEAAQQPYKLNNFCWEVLNTVPADGAPAASYTFTNPRTGWVYFLSDGDSTRTLSASGANPQTIRASGTDGVQEAMRWLPEGSYVITVSGTGALDGLIARSVAATFFCMYPTAPYSWPTAPDWTYFDTNVWPSTNSIVCGDSVSTSDVATWAGRGKRWIDSVYIGHCPTPVTSTSVYNFLVAQPGITNQDMDGLILDEFGPNYDLTAWREGCDDLLNEYPDKFVIPWVTFHDDKTWGIRGFLNVIMDHGSYFAWERYISEYAASEAELVDKFDLYIGQQMDGTYSWVTSFDEDYPTDTLKKLTSHMILTLGCFNAPPFSSDIFPNRDFKVRKDLEYHYLATNYRFDGLAGVMEYKSDYTDDEMMRWQGKLFRHYVLEGNKTRLSTDPYVLSHLRNPDFEGGITGWSLTPADTGTIYRVARSDHGYATLQGRFEGVDVAVLPNDTFLVTERDADNPNTFSQTITDLSPDRYYSLRMITGDYDDFLSGTSSEKTHALTIDVDNAEVLTAPDTNYTYVYCHRMNYGPFTSGNRYWMNYHYRIFKALGTTATLRITDWADPNTPGGPTGQQLMHNFIQVQPYVGTPAVPDPTIGISVAPDSFSFGIINPGTTKTNDGSPLVVQNTGNVAADVGLRIGTQDDRGEWTVGTPGLNVYAISARLANEIGVFSSNDSLTTNVQWCNGTNFGGGGNDMSAGATVNQWFQFVAPTDVTGAHAKSERSIRVEVSCRQAE